MIVLGVLGVLLALVSGAISAIMLGILYRAQRQLDLHGIREPLPLDRKTSLIVLGWLAAFIIGVVLAAAGFLNSN
jgi:hypothetical protein